MHVAEARLDVPPKRPEGHSIRTPALQYAPGSQADVSTNLVEERSPLNTMEGRGHGLPGVWETEVAWREGEPSTLHDNTLPEHTSDTTHTESIHPSRPNNVQANHALNRVVAVECKCCITTAFGAVR